ncbi:hypothetical protein [Thalassotalea sp. SU-HH00458]|uniref:hypothetical protein n=1 Tax=Thalassotalea sp. SU-HH00458 TaxID=3127657 RepID=UPI003107E322
MIELLQYDENVLKKALEVAKQLVNKEQFEDEKTTAHSIQLNSYTTIYKVNDKYYYTTIKLHDKNYGINPHLLPSEKYHRQSLGTQDLEQAKINAMLMAERIKTEINNNTYKEKIHYSLAPMIRECIRNLKDRAAKKKSLSNSVRKNTLEEYADFLEKQFAPFCRENEIKRVEELTSANIARYFEYLRDSDKIKSSTRFRVNKTAVTELLDLCLFKGMLKKESYPDFPSAKYLNINFKKNQKEKNNGNSDDKRKPFKLDDLHNINSNFDAFIEAIKRKNKKVIYNRHILKLYFDFLCAQGCRPGEETLNVLFSDIEKEMINDTDFYYKITFTAGKMGEQDEPRTVELVPAAADVIIKIMKYRTDETMTLDQVINLEGYLFFDVNTQNKPGLDKIWEQYRDFLFDQKLLSQSYVLYSCRHEYINKALDEGQDIRAVAKHCGNSVATIEQHYDDFCIVRQKKRKALNNK